MCNNKNKHSGRVSCSACNAFMFVLSCSDSLILPIIIEPPNDKPNKMTVRPAKTQISLGICPVWSESSLEHLNSIHRIWASSWDYGIYHTGDQQWLRRDCTAAQSHQSLRCFHTCSMEVDEGSTKYQRSSPTGWLCMCVWRMSLRRTKSTIILWHGSVVERFFFCFFLIIRKETLILEAS